MCEYVACRQGNAESQRSRIPCLAALNALAPGKQGCLRLKPVFFIEKKKCFRWVTWGMLLYTVTGIWIHLMFVLSLKSTTRLCLIPHSILHTGQMWPFALSLFTAIFSIVIFHHQYISCWPPFFNQKLCSLSFSLSLSHSLSFSLSCNQRLCLRITVISGNSASPLNRTIIYLFMYNENECTLLISSWNKHSKCLH